MKFSSLLALTITFAAASCVAIYGVEAQVAATHYGEVSQCALHSVDLNNLSRLACKFNSIDAARSLHIEYVSGECVSTRNGAFSVKEFQIIAIPGSTVVPYQLPVPRSALNSAYVNGSFTFSASPTSIYANAGTQVLAYVDLVFPPYGPSGLIGNIESCTVSLSGVFTAD